MAELCQVFGSYDMYYVEKCFPSPADVTEPQLLP
jgi:hypothetical protein